MIQDLFEERTNPWPPGYRCCVAFSFDLDGETLWLSRDSNNITRPITLSQGAYGYKEGIPRILRLLKKYELAATFFVPGWVVERKEDLVKAIHDLGHEIGHHGYLHEWPDKLNSTQEREIMVKGLHIIERVLGQRPVGYRSPAAEFSENTLALLLEHEFSYSGTMMDSDLPYLHKIDGDETSLVELPFKWHNDDAVHFMYANRPPIRNRIADPVSVFNMWKLEFDCACDEHLWLNFVLHPQIIGQPHRVRLLEKLIIHIKHFSDIWMPTMAEAAAYWRSKMISP